MPPRPRRPAPEPLEVDEVKVVGAGTALWLVALVVLLVVPEGSEPDVRGTWIWTAAAGFGLGVVGTAYCRRRRSRMRRDARSRAADRHAPPIEPLT